MKKIVLIILGIFFVVLGAEARQRVLEDLDNVDDVERVYIGPYVISKINMGGIVAMNKDGIRNLRGMEILTASNRNVSKRLKAAFSKFVEKSKYILVTEIQDAEGEYTRIYARQTEKKSPDMVSTVIIEQSTGKTLTLIAIDADVDITKLFG